MKFKKKPVEWGRLVESAVGAHLINSTEGTKTEIFYWRERNKEVDFVIVMGDKIAAIEVKSGKHNDYLSGMAVFNQAFKPTRNLLVGGSGIPLEEFLSVPASYWLT